MMGFSFFVAGLICGMWIEYFRTDKGV